MNPPNVVIHKPKIIGKHSKPLGVTPAIILIDPKYDHNVGTVKRLASAFGVTQIWITGNRVKLEGEGGKRLPREERMKGYDDVDLIAFDYPFEQFENAVPVAVEVRSGCESLPEFEHPENAVYVFGPEDGGLTAPVVRHCHRFVAIPTKHCLNLATAVACVLYDRMLKRRWNGDDEVLPLELTLAEHRGPVGRQQQS